MEIGISYSIAYGAGMATTAAFAGAAATAAFAGATATATGGSINGLQLAFHVLQQLLAPPTTWTRYKRPKSLLCHPAGAASKPRVGKLNTLACPFRSLGKLQ